MFGRYVIVEDTIDFKYWPACAIPSIRNMLRESVVILSVSTRTLADVCVIRPSTGPTTSVTPAAETVYDTCDRVFKTCLPVRHTIFLSDIMIMSLWHILASWWRWISSIWVNFWETTKLQGTVKMSSSLPAQFFLVQTLTILYFPKYYFPLRPYWVKLKQSFTKFQYLQRQNVLVGACLLKGQGLIKEKPFPSIYVW